MADSMKKVHEIEKANNKKRMIKKTSNRCTYYFNKETL